MNDNSFICGASIQFFDYKAHADLYFVKWAIGIDAFPGIS